MIYPLNAIPIILQDAIDNNQGAVWDLIRKAPHYYNNNNPTPDWFHDPHCSNSSIYFLNPLNHKVIEIWYQYNEWKMFCNFTEHESTHCIITVDSVGEDCLAALLPYSGLAEEDYNDLPF